MNLGLFSSILVADPRWYAYAAAVLLVAWAAAAWSYRAVSAGPVRRIGMGLRTAALVLLCLCLLEPLWTGQRARPGANLLAVVADNSRSLQVTDGGARSRGDELRGLLASDPNGWQAVLEQQFEVRRFLVDARLQAESDPGLLTFDGRASALGGGLRDLAARFAGRPLAGILLFTDGNATDWAQLPDALPVLPPVYPVVLGRPGAVVDLALERVRMSQAVFEDAPVSVQADVAVTGFDGERVALRLFDTQNRLVQEKTFAVAGRDARQTLRLQWKPERPGLSFYELRVGLAGDGAAAPAPAASREATLRNNQRVLAVQRDRGPYRILYVAGRPNWEYKFLQRALQADDQLQLAALIRVALREPKFDFRGRAGETGNPLFRGFGNQSREEVERYDQPVLTRLNTRDELELRSGFPSTPEELFAYHAVIVDDLEAAFFSPVQAALLQRFVSERGGGFLMLGGMECFQEGQYQRTPIGDLLPVYLDRAIERRSSTGAVRFQLAREGWIQPWARLHDNEGDEQQRLEAMPPFQTINRVREVKPGASVLATALDAQGHELPALVTQRFGRGRSAALTVGDLWRWGMQSPDARKEMEKSWRQIARWLVTDVPQRLEINTEPASDSASGAVQIQVRARDEKFQPVDDAEVYLSVQRMEAAAAVAGTNAVAVTNAPLQLRAEASATEPGLYEATFVPRVSGGYQVTAAATNATGASLGQVTAGWSSELDAEEFRSLQPNLPFLEELARRTGGEVLRPTELAAFAQRLPGRPAPVMEAWTTPAWHSPVLFALALGCLAAEWGIRRRQGLP